MIKNYYIASWTDDENRGIWSLQYDYGKDAAVSLKRAAEIDSATYFVRGGDILYALSEIAGPGDYAGQLHSFRMTGDGGLEKLDELDGVPSGSPHLSLCGENIYTASYNNGKLCSAKLLPGGGFGEITGIYQQTGHSINPSRQEGPHAHIMCPSPDGKFIICCDLGTDELNVYSVSSADGTLTLSGKVKTPAGYGPRHMIFSEDGKRAYVVCELQYHVLTYSWDGNGSLVPLGDLKVIDDLPEDKNWGGAIKSGPDGRIFVTNRPEGMSSIDVLSIENPDRPECIGSLGVCEHPRDFMFTHVGERDILICLNMTSGIVRFFEYDSKNIQFRLLSEISGIVKPVCIVEQ